MQTNMENADPNQSTTPAAAEGTTTPAEGTAAPGAAADKAKEAAAALSKNYSQEEVDRLLAAARRDGMKQGERSAEKRAATLVEKALEPFKPLLAQRQAETATPPAAEVPAAPAADKKPAAAAEGKKETAPVADPEVAAELQKLREQAKANEAQLRAITRDNEQRMAREKESQKTAQKNKAIDDAATLFKGQGLSDTAARTLAKAKIADGDIVIDDKGVASMKTGEVDDESGEPVTLPLKPAIDLWSRSNEANELRPPVARGAGASNATKPLPGAGTSGNKIDDKNLSPGQRWQLATAADQQKRAGSRTS